MSSFQTIVINSSGTAADFSSVCPLAVGGLDAIQSLENYFGALEGGLQMADLAINVGAVKATAVITSTGAATANQTMTLLGVTLTAKTSGAVLANGEFNLSATVATQAANIAATINAVVAFSGIISATSALGVTTVTASAPGVIGNGLVASDVDLANVAVTSFAGGSNGTSYSISAS